MISTLNFDVTYYMCAQSVLSFFLLLNFFLFLFYWLWLQTGHRCNWGRCWGGARYLRRWCWRPQWGWSATRRDERYASGECSRWWRGCHRWPIHSIKNHRRNPTRVQHDKVVVVFNGMGGACRCRAILWLGWAMEWRVSFNREGMAQTSSPKRCDRDPADQGHDRIPSAPPPPAYKMERK